MPRESGLSRLVIVEKAMCCIIGIGPILFHTFSLRSSLAEVKVPPGPRLLILDHVDQYRHLLKPAGPLPVRKATK